MFIRHVMASDRLVFASGYHQLAKNTQQERGKLFIQQRHFYR
ncbi:hypothetical protein [Spartinivicinus marinus]|nr:hypothetical protein [Spartinivicinus marinus]MCX4030107.1 hypothetical protein [Spartinivicinus marinus]